MNYKIGDKVEIVNDFSFHLYTSGDIVEIVNLDENSDMPYLCEDENGVLCWLYESDIS